MEIKRDDSLIDQLLELRAVTLLTGAIHDAQIFQLKVWACLVFNNSAEIQLTTDPKCSVTFISDTSPELNILEGLDRSVKYILGDHFRVIIKNGETELLNSPGARKKKKYRNDR